MAKIFFFSLQSIERTQAPADRSAPYLRRTEEVDAETVESACFKTLGRRVGIAGEDGAGEVRAQPLHGAARRTRARARRRRRRSCTDGRTPPWARADCGGGGCDGEWRRGGRPRSPWGCAGCGGRRPARRRAARRGRRAVTGGRAGAGGEARNRRRGWTPPRDLRATGEGREPAMNKNEE
jgi:hypothetical protein